jgi:hypothetical protein
MVSLTYRIVPAGNKGDEYKVGRVEAKIGVGFNVLGAIQYRVRLVCGIFCSTPEYERKVTGYAAKKTELLTRVQCDVHRRPLHLNPL